MRAFATSPDGTPIAYEALGTGLPALVFVHGWSCDRGYWDGQLIPLSASTTVVALDLAGHGESGVARREWSIAAFGADVAAVIGHLSLQDVILIGHSMGGDVVLEASLRLQGLVRGLVWVDQYTQLSRFMSEVQVQQRMAPFRADFANAAKAFVRGMFAPSTDPSLVERIAADISSAPPHVALGALEATWNHGRNVPAILSQLKLPLVAINAQNLSTDIDSMARHGVRVVLMPGVGHFPMLERPLEFNACLVQVVGAMVSEDGSDV